jgi:hypothetical protein
VLPCILKSFQCSQLSRKEIEFVRDTRSSARPQSQCPLCNLFISLTLPTCQFCFQFLLLPPHFTWPRNTDTDSAVRDAQKTISDSERLLKSAAPASQQWKSCQQIKKLSTHVFLYEQNIWQRGNGIPDNEAASNNQDFLRARHSSNQRLKRHHANVESLSGYASTITESFRMECRWKWGHATGEKASVISLTKELWMLTHNSC